MTIRKIISAILGTAILLSLAGCGSTTPSVPKETDAAIQSDSADVTSDTESSDDITAELPSASELDTQPPAESEEDPAEEKTPTPQPTTPSTEKPAETEASKPSEPPKQTEIPKPTETPKQTETQTMSKAPTESTKPAVPSETEEPKPTEQPKAATADDCKAIADKIVQYINSYRSVSATKLPGLTDYAEYRSRQIVSNFAHDTDDQRAAATTLQYGEYIEPSLYGMTGEPYYTANAKEAIAKAGYRGTVDYVAEQLALQFKNSTSLWSYISDTKYQYIAVGVTYQNGTWYCAVALTQTNTDNN